MSQNSTGSRPAEIQITAEQLISDAYEYRPNPIKSTDTRIEDLEELHAYQRRKRQEYEGVIRRNRFNFGQWMRYAQFEIDQHDLLRARSVFERALEVDPNNVALWIRYIQSEIKTKNVNHARNLLDRATTILPRVDKLWYQYTATEESLGTVVAARAVFRKWLQWKPNAAVWKHYVAFEERYQEHDNCREIFEKWVMVYSDADTWRQWAEFEQRHGDQVNVRNVYKLATNTLYRDNKLDASILQSWIRYEAEQGNYDKVKELFAFGDSSLSDSEKVKLHKSYSEFQKRHGSTMDITESVLNHRRAQYRSVLESNPTDYDTWWLYLDTIVSTSTADDIRDKFGQSISQVPQSNDKFDWVHWYYLGKRYANWEELKNKDVEAAAQVYKALIKAVPHKQFTIHKLWEDAADFHIRQGNIGAARKLLGTSMGMCPDRHVIDHYIAIETQLKNFDRARMIYNKLLENFPHDYHNWLAYIELEEQLGDTPRVQYLVNIALSNDFLSARGKLSLLDRILPQIVADYNFAFAKTLMDRAVAISDNDARSIVKRCLFELQVPSADQIADFEKSDDSKLEFAISDDAKSRAREQFEHFLNSNVSSETRAMLLKSLVSFEEKYGTPETATAATERLPKVTRTVRMEDGIQVESEEYVFPEDEVEQFKKSFNRFEE